MNICSSKTKKIGEAKALASTSPPFQNVTPLDVDNFNCNTPFQLNYVVNVSLIPLRALHPKSLKITRSSWTFTHLLCSIFFSWIALEFSKKCALLPFFIMCSLGIFIHEMVSKLLLMIICWIFCLHNAIEFFSLEVLLVFFTSWNAFELLLLLQ